MIEQRKAAHIEICAAENVQAERNCWDDVTLVHDAVPDGRSCDDGDPCTGYDECVDGECTPGEVGAMCDDDNPCTQDTCSGGDCGHEVLLGTACDDGDPDTANDTCDHTGACVGESSGDGGASSDGCGCRAARRAPGGAPGLALLAALVAGFLARRRQP